MASKIIKDVFENYSKYQLKAKKQMIVNTDMFSHEAMKEKLEKIVDKILESIPQKVQLTLPKLGHDNALSRIGKKKSVEKVEDIKLPKLKKG